METAPSCPMRSGPKLVTNPPPVNLVKLVSSSLFIVSNFLVIFHTLSDVGRSADWGTLCIALETIIHWAAGARRGAGEKLQSRIVS